MRKICKWLSLIIAMALMVNCAVIAEGECQHAFEEHVLKEATCTEKGILMQHCPLCNERSYSAIEPMHHYNAEPDVIVPPTCDEAGGLVWYCTVCNTQQDPEAEGVYCETTPPAHTYNGEIKYVPASCEEMGKFVRYCTVCNAEDVLQMDEASMPTGHDWQFEHIPAGCETNEKYMNSCAICGAVRWETKIELSAPAGHTMPEEYTVISEADCENAAVITWDCTVCGKHVEEAHGEPAGHVVEEKMLVEATCSQDGLVNHVCAVCGEMLSENVVVPMAPACEPYEIVISPSTCTENGIREYRCKWCDQHLYFAAISCGHEAGEVETVIAPTCTENGLGQVRCTVCGELLKEIDLPAAGHAYTHEPVLKTVDCTNESYAVLLCEKCGHEMICAEDEDKETPVHQQAYRYYAPTCEACGVLEIYCAACDEVLATIEVADDKALGHLYGEEKTVIKAPDCENSGTEAWVCTRCNAQHEESEIPALGHSLEMQAVKEATCIESGIANRVCTVCGKTLEEDIILQQKTACEAKQEILIAPTCTSDGLCQYVCKWCDLLMGYGIVPAGHVAGEPIVEKAPTCTEEGVEKILCTACGDELETRAIPCIEHSYGNEPTTVIAATCTEPAMLHYACLVCGAEEAVKTVPSGDCLGHTWLEETQQLPADCVTPARTVKVCGVCGETEVISYDRSAPAVGHQLTYTMAEPTCTEPMMVCGVCANCGYEVEREPAGVMEGIITEALGHTLPDEWTVEKEPTCQTSGLRSKYCLVCNALVEQEEIPPVACAPQLACVLQKEDCVYETRNVSLMTCKWCEEIVCVDVSNYEHVFDEEKAVVLVEAGCETEGLMLKKCEKCGYEEKVTLEAVGHIAGEPIVQPGTCERGERVVILCTRCNEVLSVEAEMGEALGHDFGVFDPQIGKNICIYCREIQPD